MQCFYNLESPPNTMAYTAFEIEVIFDRLWELYPNKAKESSARKALTVALKTGEDHHQIEQAVKIYALETRGDEYHYHFSNFINEHHWKDIIDAHSNVDHYLRSLEENERTARKVIECWNLSCKPHWCKVTSPDKKIAIAIQALRDADFRASWEVALQKATGIFKFKFKDGDWRANIVLSIRWFCNVSTDKHTVLKILEGEYGKEQGEYKPRYRENETPLTQKERDEVMKMWHEVMNSNEDKIHGQDFELS